MPTVDALPSACILDHAERELGAFLQAVPHLVGRNGLAQARDLWIETLRDADCPGEDLNGFFRGVTVRTISQLASNPEYRTSLGANRAQSRLNICA